MKCTCQPSWEERYAAFKAGQKPTPFDITHCPLHGDGDRPVVKSCVDCGNPVEAARECYVFPTCYECLPPPPLAMRKAGNSGPFRILFDDSCTCQRLDYSSVYMRMHEGQQQHCPQHGPQHERTA